MPLAASPAPTRREPIVELINISKQFKGNYALRGVNLALYPGEIHGLLGENGAGKSTLIKILTGVYGPSGGRIRIGGAHVAIRSPLEAHRLGIGAVYQDAELVGGFSVAENVLLGSEPPGWFVNKRAIRAETARRLSELGIPMDAGRMASKLSAAEMQLVTLLSLVHKKYKVLVLDEPTARLSATESEILFRLIDLFKKEGITIIYISHRLEEVKRLCDRVTVLRNGVVSGTRERKDISEDEITRLMIAEDAKQLVVQNTGLARGDVLLEVSDLRTDRLRGISFSLRSGEILGITGPVGAGMEDVGRALAGLAKYQGAVRLAGRAVTVRSPAAARAAGIAMIPEDRRRQALFNDMSVGFNLSLPAIGSLTRWGLSVNRLMNNYAAEIIGRLDIRPKNPGLEIKYLSGGNQQKALIGKWLKAKASVYVVIEPTAGVDVGAIKEIYGIILDMARQGSAVIVISSTIKEILALSEKVMVIQDGVVSLFKDRSKARYEELLALAVMSTGVSAAPAP